MIGSHDSPASSALALVLAAALLVPTALAGSHGDSPADGYRDFTGALDAGDAQRASSIYEKRFRQAASTAPAVQQALEDALATARKAGPNATEGQAAAKTAEKALLAVAFHAVQDAGRNGSVENAQAFFDVIEVGFGDEEPIAALAPTFANATEDDLPEAVDRLEEAFLGLTLAEAYHETEETPGLVEGGDAREAALEAGEAAGYALGFRADLEARLGASSADRLDAELGELVELAAAGDGEGAVHEAEEILALLAEYGIASAPQEKAEAFERYEEALEEGNLGEAREIYNASFRGEALEYASQADRRIQEAFTQARQAGSEGDEAEAIETLEKTILDIAWRVGFHELAEGEVHEGLEWLAPLPATFGWYEDRPEAALPLGHLAASGEASRTHVDALEANLGEALSDKVREEVAEVFVNWNDTATARAKAAEAVLYARPAKAFFEAGLGSAPTEELFDELDVLRNQTRAGEREAAREAGDEVVKLLDKLSGREGATDLEQVLVEVEDKAAFVAEEYRGWAKAKQEGDSDEARTELGEAHAFTNATLDVVQANQDLLEPENATAYTELVDRLETVQTLLSERAPVDEVTAEIDAIVELLDAFRVSQGPSVDVRFGTPEPAGDGAAWIPVQLSGVPTGGFSIQARISYDADTLEVQEVQIPPQVGAKTIEDGQVRFNAASAEDAGSSPTVARLKIAPTGQAQAVELSITVDTLTDAQGKPLTVGNVTGGTVDLASLDAGGEGNASDTQPAPALAPVVVLAWLVAIALVLGRRER